LRRVSRRQVVFTWDPEHTTELWIISEYLPEIHDMERAMFTPLSEVVEALGAHTVLPFPVPHDFTDGFQVAYRRRPRFYLDAAVRQATSTFAQLPPAIVEPAIARLREDLRTGEGSAATRTSWSGRGWTTGTGCSSPASERGLGPGRGIRAGPGRPFPNEGGSFGSRRGTAVGAGLAAGP
jgi:hypothetical protein